MAERDNSPGEQDQARMVQEMGKAYPGRDLKDRTTFNDTWFDYFSNNDAFAVSIGVRDESYSRFVFKEAGGKDFDRDRKFRAKETADTPEQYIKRGSQRVDFENVDTPPK